MSIRKLEYFIATVEQGSFSNAASQLYLSPSAINQQITSLEQETNLILFDRTSYKPTLTSSGIVFYERAKRIVKEYYEAINAARAAHNILRIGPTGPVESQRFPKLIESFQQTHPEVQFELTHGTFRMMREGLLNASLDIAFGIADDFDDPMIEVSPLETLEMVVVCSKKHPLANEKTVKGSQLGDYPLVIFSKETGAYYYQNMLHAFKLDGVTPTISGTYHNVDELLTAVRIQKGMAVISKEVVKNQNDLVLIPLVDTHHHSTYCIAHAKNASDLCLSFVDMVKKEAIQKL